MLKNVLVFLLAVFFVAGCGGIANKEASTDIKAESKLESKSEFELETAKYRVYARQNNFLNWILDRNLKDYFEAAGREEQPKKTNVSVSAISESYLAKIEQAYKYVDQKPPIDAVDNNVKELYPKIKKLTEVFREAELYYKSKGYVDDNYKKAQEIHAKMLKADSEYRPLKDKFSGSFNAFTVEFEKKEMDEWQQKDFMVHYSAQDVLNKAKELQQEMDAQNVKARNILDMDFAKFKEKYDNLIKAAEQFQAYAKDSDQLKKEGIDPDKSSFENYSGGIANVKVAAREIFERLKSKQAFQRYQLVNTRWERGTPENYNDQLNDAIKAHSHWMWGY